jgi:hypothetical protein
LEGNHEDPRHRRCRDSRQAGGALLRAAGAEVTTLSRHGDIACDLLAGDVPRIDADVVVHLAGGQKGDDIATRNLLAACAGVHHFVYISVIGADTVPLAWLRTKLLCAHRGTSGVARNVAGRAEPDLGRRPRHPYVGGVPDRRLIERR